MKVIKKYRVYIVISIIVVMLVLVILAFRSFLYPSDSKSLYGNRLDGIENVKIDSNQKMGIVNEIKTNSEVENVSMNIHGTIVNIVIRGKEELTVDKAKEIYNNSLNKFSKKEKEFYDLQFFATTSKYNLIGYKNKVTEGIVWTVSEVDNDEKTE